MLEDQTGYVWIGTQDGLNRFDGSGFKVFRHNPDDQNSLSSSFINDLLRDSKDRLWVATNAGINLYNDTLQQFANWRHQTNEHNSLSHDQVLCLFEDSKQRIWVGTTSGLNLMDPIRGTFQRFIHDDSIPGTISHNHVTSIEEDHHGNLWIGTNAGLNQLNPDKGTFTIFRHQTEKQETLSDNRIKSLFVDHQDLLWIGTSNGLNAFDVTNGRIKRYMHDPDRNHSISDNDITAIFEDHLQALWIGTGNGGLNFFNRATSHFSRYQHDPRNPYSISNNTVWSILEDQNKNLWVGVSAKGVNFHDRQTELFKHYKHLPEDENSLIHNSVRAIFRDQTHQLWIGTFGGLSVYDVRTGKSRRFQHDPKDLNSLDANYVLSIFQDLENRIWVGTSQGLNRYDAEKQAFIRQKLSLNPAKDHQNFAIERIYQTEENQLWLSTDQGLLIFDSQSGIVQHFDQKGSSTLSSKKVGSVVEGQNGMIWIGTDHGLNRLNPRNNSITQFYHDPEDPSSLGHNRITHIAEDAKGQIWISSESGLSLFQRETKNFRSWRTKHGLSNEFIYGGLMDSNGKLWLSTNMGINKFNPEDQSFTIYNERSGLQSNEFNSLAYYRDMTGFMYFGGVNGLSVFHPDSITDNQLPPSVVLTDFLLFNKSVMINDSSVLQQSLDHTQEITIEAKDDLFAFEFTALEFQQPEKVKYAYLLEPYDKNWIYTDHTDRKAVFTRVPAGTYTFRVKATTDQNNWPKQEKSIVLKVLPPWWKTWWAYAIYVACFLTIIYLILRFQWNRIQFKQRLKLEQKEAEQVKKLDRLKTRFFTNITHEFRTPLTLILGPAEQILKQDQLNEGFTREQVGLIRRNSQKFLELVNQLLDLSKLEGQKMSIENYRGDLREFLQIITENFQPFANQKHIHLSFESQLSVGDYMFDRIKLDKIICNLLSNALKFTNDQGTVQLIANMRLGEQNEHLGISIMVKDSGVGISPESLPFIFDRFYQVDDDARHKHEGTGIGLSLTKELIELQGGTINVVSELGTGTTFSIFLPYEKSTDPISVSDHETSFQSISKNRLTVTIEANDEAVEQFEETSEKPSLLILEDNHDLRRFISSVLKSNYQVITAKDGAAGIAKALKYIPDLIISDLMMPEMDGFEVCHFIKNHQLTNHIPVVLLTAKSNLKSRVEGFKTGADMYLTKPFNMEELQVVIEKLILTRKELQKRFSHEMTLDEQTMPALGVLDQKLINNLNAYIESELSNEALGVEDLVKESGMSHSQLYRKIKALTDFSIAGFIRNYRLIRALEILKEGQHNVTEVANMTGFGNRRYFHKVFVEKYAYPPSEVRKLQA